MRIHKNSLIQVATAILTSAGAEADRAHAVAEHLVIANEGHDSHGVGMVPNYVGAMVNGLINPQSDVKLTRDNGAVLTFDGDLGFGRIVGMQAMDKGIERASPAFAVSLLEVQRISGASAHSEHCAEAGLIFNPLRKRCGP